jgi:dolichol kinase
VTDLLWGAAWCAALAGGVLVCVALKRAGVATTHVRDLLHVGAGVWVLGWPCFRAPAVPLAIVGVAAAATALVPLAARRLPAAARLRDALSGGDERWGGLTAYTVAFAGMTALAFFHAPFPAGAALLALALGDGIGGLVGRRLGRVGYRLPWAKPKSLEGSLTVAVLAAAGALAAAAWFDAPLGVGRAALAGVVAAVVEGASPRASDNLLVPAAVWATLVG